MEIKIVNISKKTNVFYEVQFGDSFEQISKLFSVPVEYIKQNNPGTLYEGKFLFLPETNFKTYVVKPFDTLSKIATDFSVTVESLKMKNSLSNDYVFVGQKLYI